MVHCLPDGICKRGFERRESIIDGETDLIFGDLTVEIPCRQTLPK